ncbi:hypothetical protein C8R44DRAFT_755535 [Mycena epipterygia]|nr:hypothetical protein C8R44DRAFT_755535 [Mycena epipterygia]
MAPNDVPVDIIMEITGHLDLPDSLQLVATCSNYRTLSSSRYFWIMALNRMEQLHRRPLPCSPGTDIMSLPLATLQEFALHAYKLKKNWASAPPRALSTRRLVTEHPILTFCPIEASHLLLTLSRTRLACWDTTSGECVAAFEHPEGYTSVMGDPYLSPRKCSVGIVYQRFSTTAMEIVAFQIDHQGPAVTLSKVVSKNWTAADLESVKVTDVVVNDKMVAVLPSNDTYDSEYLLFCGFGDAIIHRIPLDSNGTATLFQGLIYGDDVYVSRQHLFAEFGRIRISATPDDLKMDITKLDIPFSVHGIEDTPTVSWSRLRYPGLHFWPAEITGSPSEVINFRPLCFYEHSSSITDFGVGSSGTCVAIIDEAKTLGLVQYTLHPATKITFRRLWLPDVEVVAHTDIALDDRLGVVYLYNRTQPGAFDLISYA